MTLPNSIETTGDSVEEAIAKGIAELGVSPSQVIVEVLEEGSRGILGIGARPARVRLQMLSVPMPPPPPAPEPAPAPESPMREERVEREDRPAAHPPRGERRERPARRPRPPRAPEPDDLPDYLDLEEEETPFLPQADEVPEAEWDDEAQIARVVLGELLSHLGLRGRIAIRRAAAAGEGESTPWILDVVGGSLNRLIGRRGETLASLQYITRLITSRELQRRSEIIVDVEGYKARRAAALHALALRMAESALEQNRTVSLEPMPPHERRIIHLALRGRTDVMTRSVGEGATRKVTIVPNPPA
jgi:spoIIIJ-associated protein